MGKSKSRVAWVGVRKNAENTVFTHLLSKSARCLLQTACARPSLSSVVRPCIAGLSKFADVGWTGLWGALMRTSERRKSRQGDPGEGAWQGRRREEHGEGKTEARNIVKSLAGCGPSQREKLIWQPRDGIPVIDPPSSEYPAPADSISMPICISCQPRLVGQRRHRPARHGGKKKNRTLLGQSRRS